MTRRDFSKVRRPEPDGPSRLPVITRTLVYRHEFKPGSDLSVYVDNEVATYEAVLTRAGLPTRSGRIRKAPLADSDVPAIVRYLVG